MHDNSFDVSFTRNDLALDSDLAQFQGNKHFEEEL